MRERGERTHNSPPFFCYRRGQTRHNEERFRVSNPPTPLRSGGGAHQDDSSSRSSSPSSTAMALATAASWRAARRIRLPSGSGDTAPAPACVAGAPPAAATAAACQGARPAQGRRRGAAPPAVPGAAAPPAAPEGPGDSMPSISSSSPSSPAGRAGGEGAARGAAAGAAAAAAAAAGAATARAASSRLARTAAAWNRAGTMVGMRAARRAAAAGLPAAAAATTPRRERGRREGGGGGAAGRAAAGATADATPTLSSGWRSCRRATRAAARRQTAAGAAPAPPPPPPSPPSAGGGTGMDGRSRPAAVAARKRAWVGFGSVVGGRAGWAGWSREGAGAGPAASVWVGGGVKRDRRERWLTGKRASGRAQARALAPVEKTLPSSAHASHLAVTPPAGKGGRSCACACGGAGFEQWGAPPPPGETKRRRIGVCGAMKRPGAERGHASVRLLGVSLSLSLFPRAKTHTPLHTHAQPPYDALPLLHERPELLAQSGSPPA